MFSELLCSAWVEKGVHLKNKERFDPLALEFWRLKRKNFQANRFEKISYHVFKILTQSLLHSLTKSRKRPSPLPLTQIRWRKIKPLPPIAKPPSLNCYSCAQKNRNRIWLWWIQEMKRQQNPDFWLRETERSYLPGSFCICEDKKICYESCMKMFQNESHRIEIKHILPKYL